MPEVRAQPVARRRPARGLGIGSSTRALDGSVARLVCAWFAENARPLPWRVANSRSGARRDPYRTLVAETMLQQTQAARVVGKYTAFLKRFPSVRVLASAPLDDVLAAWTGLGYYRRAGHLHAAAAAIVERFGGRVPDDEDSLRSLPGVGRYTAGAIASIAFDRPEPIVDGNVARVLLRVHGRRVASNDRDAQTWLWERAGSLAGAAESPGEFNEGLMELGATVCLPAPARPRCDACPLSRLCRARREGTQLRIPTPKRAATRTILYCATLLFERADGAVLVEQRSRRGLWAGLWQAPTLERTDRRPSMSEVARAVGVPGRGLRRHDGFEFLATHRRMEFDVYSARAGPNAAPARGVFMPRGRIAALAVSSPQRRLLLGEAPARRT